MLRSLVLVALVVGLCACSPDKGFGETKEVSADDYGSAWPLTVDTAKLNKVCDEANTAVAVLIEGRSFNVSDLTSPDEADEAFLRFWAEDPSAPSGRKDLAPLADDGEALCD